MARNLFGGTASDVAEDVAGARVPGVVGTVWYSSSEGDQVTDLLDSNGAPIDSLTADENGMISEFQGPDDGAERLWLDFGAGVRVAILATNVGERLSAHLTAPDPHGTQAAAVAEIETRMGAPLGFATLDGSGLISSAQVPSALDWINVKSNPYGAKGDGTADDTTAIQRAINDAGVGGVVYIPKGVFKISAPLDLPKGVSLVGSHSNLMIGPGMRDDDFPCYIQAAPTFNSGSMIQIIGDNDGVHPAINGEQRISNLMLDGSKVASGSLDGIYAKGNVQNVVMRDVCVRKLPNNGIITGSNAGGEWPYSWRLEGVMVDNCHANGFAFERNTDLTMINCQAIGCWATGFKLINCANSTLNTCRSEWTGGHGFWLTGAWGNWPGSGSATLSACSTDRSGWDGVRIDATGNAPFIINALMTRRDGRNGGPGGGGYAGLALLNRSPVVVNGVTCYPGTDDGGTANTSPQYGVRISGARDVQLDGAYLHAATAGLYDDGTNERVTLGNNITTVAGNNYSEARIPSAAYALTAKTAYATKGVYAPPSWGEFWKPKRDAAATGGKARIVVVGGSASQGYYASNLHSGGWVGNVRQALQSKFGNGGSGFYSTSRSGTYISGAEDTQALTSWRSVGCVITQTGSWTLGGSNYGPGCTYIYADTTGASSQFKFTGSTLKIYTVTGGTRAGYTYKIDAGGTVAVPQASGGATDIAVTTVSGLSAGDHTVTITWNGTASGTGQYLSIVGVSGENASGIVVDNLAKAGAKASTFGNPADTALNAVWNGGKSYPADLVIFTAGPNDAAATPPTSGDAWANSVAKYIQTVKNANNGATDIMFVLPHLGKHDVTNYVYQDYAVRARGLAEAYGGAIVDLWTLGRTSWDYWNSLGYWGNPAAVGTAGTDSVHLSDTGYAYAANQITPLLMA
jgi:lysophospholipase L1-like esterase